MEGNILVNHVHNTICNDEIRLNDLCGIDKYFSILNRNCEICALHCFQGHPGLQECAIAHKVGNDMVLEQSLEICSCRVLGKLRSVCERCGGIRDEKCYVGNLKDLVYVEGV